MIKNIASLVNLSSPLLDDVNELLRGFDDTRIRQLSVSNRLLVLDSGLQLCLKRSVNIGEPLFEDVYVAFELLLVVLVLNDLPVEL